MSHQSTVAFCHAATNRSFVGRAVRYDTIEVSIYMVFLFIILDLTFPAAYRSVECRVNVEFVFHVGEVFYTPNPGRANLHPETGTTPRPSAHWTAAARPPPQAACATSPASRSRSGPLAKPPASQVTTRRCLFLIHLASSASGLWVVTMTCVERPACRSRSSTAPSAPGCAWWPRVPRSRARTGQAAGTPPPADPMPAACRPTCRTLRA